MTTPSLPPARHVISGLALAFAANSEAAGLIDDDRAVNRYRPALSIA